MINREERAQELQRRREELDRFKDDDDDKGGKPVVRSPDWGERVFPVPIY